MPTAIGHVAVSVVTSVTYLCDKIGRHMSFVTFQLFGTCHKDFGTFLSVFVTC